MRLMSVDQSISHCAVVIWEHGVPIYREMIRTGSNSSRSKKNKDVVYYDTVYEQIRHIVKKILELIDKYKIDKYVMEDLSFGSVGNATRDLAGLFHCIVYALCDKSPKWLDNIHKIPPTSLKSFARNLLPEKDREIVKERLDKKTGKKVYSSRKVKMEKSHMIRAVDCVCPGWLDGITLAAGKSDYADAYLIGKKFFEELSQEKDKNNRK